MASQSLYRKWRSQTFADLIGQEAVVRTLLNAVRDGRLAHAYLFCGPRGTGKTSTARLLAKAVNCANPRDGEPCNECLSCREITAGHSPDVVEIDAASNTGVDNIRDLRETVGLLGVGGHYRVIVVDEVHMLSTAAFNALLKTLEEPPPHVIFVLATTEAHKVLPTVVSRCQRFDFRRIGTRDIVGHLRAVAAAEGLDLELGAAELLARAAQGGMRDALSLLDQAMAYAGARITAERTRDMLGIADPGLLRRLLGYVAEQRAAEGLALINELVTSGADLRQLNSQLADEWRALVLARAGADVAALTDRAEDDAREINTLAFQFSLDELAACARVFARNETPARGLPIPQLALELSFLECVGIKTRGGQIAMVQPFAQPTNAARMAMPPAHSPAQRSGIPAEMAMPVASPPTPKTENPAETANPLTSSSPMPEVTRRAPTSPPVEELDFDAIERDAPPLADTHRTAPVAELTLGAGDVPTTPPADRSSFAVSPAPRADVPLDGVATPASPTDPVEAPVAEGAWFEDEEPVVGAQSDDPLLRAQSQWELIKQVCKQKSRSVAALLHSARPVLYQPGESPALVIQADFKFHHDKLREPASRSAIEWALQQVLEEPIRIKVVMTSSGGGADATGGTPGSGPAGSPTSNGPISPPSSGAPNGRSPALSGPNGNGSVRDASAAYSSSNSVPKAQISPIRRPDLHPVQTLEEEVRGDPVIRALLRSGGLELADVRPLGDDEEGSH